MASVLGVEDNVQGKACEAGGPTPDIDAERDELALQILKDSGTQVDRRLMAQLTQIELTSTARLAVFQLISFARANKIGPTWWERGHAFAWFVLLLRTAGDAALEVVARQTACEMLRIGLLPVWCQLCCLRCDLLGESVETIRRLLLFNEADESCSAVDARVDRHEMQRQYEHACSCFRCATIHESSGTYTEYATLVNELLSILANDVVVVCSFLQHWKQPLIDVQRFCLGGVIAVNLLVAACKLCRVSLASDRGHSLAKLIGFAIGPVTRQLSWTAQSSTAGSKTSYETHRDKVVEALRDCIDRGTCLLDDKELVSALTCLLAVGMPTWYMAEPSLASALEPAPLEHDDDKEGDDEACVVDKEPTAANPFIDMRGWDLWVLTGFNELRASHAQELVLATCKQAARSQVLGILVLALARSLSPTLLPAVLTTFNSHSDDQWQLSMGELVKLVIGMNYGQPELVQCITSDVADALWQLIQYAGQYDSNESLNIFDAVWRFLSRTAGRSSERDFGLSDASIIRFSQTCIQFHEHASTEMKALLLQTESSLVLNGRRLSEECKLEVLLSGDAAQLDQTLQWCRNWIDAQPISTMKELVATLMSERLALDNCEQLRAKFAAAVSAAVHDTTDPLYVTTLVSVFHGCINFPGSSETSEEREHHLLTTLLSSCSLKNMSPTMFSLAVRVHIPHEELPAVRVARLEAFCAAVDTAAPLVVSHFEAPQANNALRIILLAAVDHSEHADWCHCVAEVASQLTCDYSLSIFEKTCTSAPRQCAQAASLIALLNPPALAEIVRHAAVSLGVQLSAAIVKEMQDALTHLVTSPDGMTPMSDSDGHVWQAAITVLFRRRCHVGRMILGVTEEDEPKLSVECIRERGLQVLRHFSAIVVADPCSWKQNCAALAAILRCVGLDRGNGVSEVLGFSNGKEAIGILKLCTPLQVRRACTFLSLGRVVLTQCCPLLHRNV